MVMHYSVRLDNNKMSSEDMETSDIITGYLEYGDSKSDSMKDGDLNDPIAWYVGAVVVMAAFIFVILPLLVPR